MVRAEPRNRNRSILKTDNSTIHFGFAQVPSDLLCLLDYFGADQA